MKTATYAVAGLMLGLGSAACGKDPGPSQAEICCQAEGHAYPVNRQTLVHSPVTITIHRLDTAALMTPKDLADNDPPITDPVFADDETADIYQADLPLDVLDATDLVVTAKQGDIFAGTVVLHAAAAQDSMLVPRPISSSTRYATESYIRGLMAINAGETLDDELWSVWPRVGLTLPYAVSLRAHVLDEAELDALGTITVQDQQFLQTRLATLWATPGTGPLGADLRAMFVAYDAADDARAAAGLEVGGLDYDILRDAVSVIYAATDERAGDPAAKEVHELFLVRSLVNSINLPDTIFPLDPYPLFELHRQESAVAMYTMDPVFAELAEAIPCTGGGCPAFSAPQQAAADFESLYYDPESPVGFRGPDDAWAIFRNSIEVQVREYLVAAVGQTEGMEWSNILTDLYQTAGPLEALDGSLNTLLTQPSVTHDDVEAPLLTYRTQIESEISTRLPTLTPEQQAALADATYALSASQAALADTILFGLQ